MSEDQPNKYDVLGYGDPFLVEIPELDALLNDIFDVCEKHGVGFRTEGDFDERRKVILVPFVEADWDLWHEDLSSSAGVAWLDNAKRRAQQLYDDHRKKELALYREAERRRQEAHTAKLLRDGIKLDGKRYKLTEVKE